MNERTWLVLFMRWRIHWTMRWVTRLAPAYGHVMLLSPIGNGQFISYQWGMDGIFIEPIGEVAAARYMNHATELLQYDQRSRAPGNVLNSLLPATCITMARQVMGLPPRLNFFLSALSLRGELLARGAEVVMPARRDDP